MATASEMNLPCPLFEGSEKRIEVEFAFGATTPVDGLRSLEREQLNVLMSQVRCHSGLKFAEDQEPTPGQAVPVSGRVPSVLGAWSQRTSSHR